MWPWLWTLHPDCQGNGYATVTLSDHSTKRARIVGVAPNYDLAVLRIDIGASKLRPIPLG